jgi:hypothetical protein
MAANRFNNTDSTKLQLHTLHHRQIIWMHFANFFLGIWLITSPSTFDYEDPRLAWNSVLCGALVCLFSLLSVNPMRLWAPWGSALIGLWLNFSPLLFWAGQPVVYNSESLIGILILVFAFVAPGVPGSKLYEEKGSDIPPGWSVNPSTWAQRIPIITIGWIGFFASRYLTAYQLGYKSNIPDIFFGQGTENVLNSDISKAWPVSDAGLGAFSYMLDAMMGYLGGESRWRTMPWAVILFGVLIIPLGAVSIGLIILQPVAVGSWCSLCLFTAIAMLIMIPCAFDEVVASVYFLILSKKTGKSLWRTFFLGGAIAGELDEPLRHDLTLPLRKTIQEIFSDFSVPWNLVVSSLVGVWLMCSPSVFGYNDALADSDHITGALVVTFSVIAMGEIVRTFRYFNILAGLWIALAHLLLFSTSMRMELYNELVCGSLLIALSLRKGKINNSYGIFNRFIK